MFVDRRVRDAEVACLNAPFSDDGWEKALRTLAETTGNGIAQLCGANGPDLSFNLFSHVTDDRHQHLSNPLLYGPENWRINCRMDGVGSIQHERHYEEYRRANRTEFYCDASSDLDVPYGCQSPLMLDSGGLIGLALLRPERDGPCTPDVLEIFHRVSRQAQRAVRVEIALGQDRGEQMLAGLATSRESTLLLDRHGRLVAMTEAAELLFDCPIGLRIVGLKVRLTDAAEHRGFEAAMARLIASNGIDGPVLHEARVGRCASQPEGWWRLFLTRLPARVDVIGVEAQLALTLRAVTAA